MLSSADGSTLAASKRRPAARDEEARHRLSRCATVPSPFHELAHLECRYCDHTLAYPRPYGQSDILAQALSIESQLSDRVSRLFSATWDSPRGFHGPTRSLRLSEALASARHRDGFSQHEKGSQTPKPSSTEKNRE